MQILIDSSFTDTTQEFFTIHFIDECKLKDSQIISFMITPSLLSNFYFDHDKVEDDIFIFVQVVK